ncbi:MAG: amidohydrolase family protein, partial [Pseudomonadota bacterium]
MKKALVVPILLLALLGSSQPPGFDILIRNGRVVDGTGNPSYAGDVGIREGRVAAVGRLANRGAARVIDAAGLVVAPGFIDIHNHSDTTIVEDGNAESMVRQGVTSMIFGEGESAAPSDRWKDFSSYFAELLRRGIAANVGSYIGSGTVWTRVHGARSGPATTEELDRMRAIVREAMEQGALGVASSLSGPPGVWIDTDTLVAMCEVAGEYGGIYSTHLRTEGS